MNLNLTWPPRRRQRDGAPPRRRRCDRTRVDAPRFVMVFAHRTPSARPTAWSTSGSPSERSAAARRTERSATAQRCVELKFRGASLRYRRDACSMAWRCGSYITRFGHHGRLRPTHRLISAQARRATARPTTWRSARSASERCPAERRVHGVEILLQLNAVGAKCYFQPTPVHGEEVPPCDRAATLALLKARGAR